MKKLAFAALFLQFACFTALAADKGKPNNPAPAKPSSPAVHPDLEVTPPADQEKVLRQIEAAIEDMERNAANDVEKLKVSIPDYKPAYDKLQAQVTEVLTKYLEALVQIRDEMKLPLSQLAALREQVANDKTGFFQKLYDNELERLIPPLNKKINEKYQFAMRKLLTINGAMRVPMNWTRLKGVNGDYGIYKLTDQAMAEFSGPGRACTQGYYGKYSCETTANTSAFAFSEFWLVSALTAEGEAEMVAVENGFKVGLFADCKTGACVLKLNEDYASYVDTAEYFYQDIEITKPEFGAFRWGKRNPAPLITESWLRAAKGMLERGDENTRMTVAGVLEYTLGKGAGVGLGVVALPGFVLEKTARFVEQLLSSSSIRVQLKLVTPESERFGSMKSRISETATEHARTLPAVVYEK